LKIRLLFLRKNIFFTLFLAGIIFCLCSCATNRNKETVSYIWLTNNAKFILLPAHEIEKPLDGYQLMTASFSGQNYQMNTWVKADETGMDITLLNEMGANMGELIWRDGKISFSSSVFPPSMKPEYIIADFQFCFYKGQALSETLQKTGFYLTETESGRLVHRGNNIIMEITKGQNTITLNNHLRGYIYILEGEFE